MATTQHDEELPSSLPRPSWTGLPGFLPLYDEPPTIIPARGILSALITSNRRRASSLRVLEDDTESFRHAGSPDALHRSMRKSSHLRSERLIGSSNPRYQWQKYWKTPEELQRLRKPLRDYYQRSNMLVQQYLYIDRLLDSSLPADLLNEYSHLTPMYKNNLDTPSSSRPSSRQNSILSLEPVKPQPRKRTPREIYRLPSETTSLIHDVDGDYDGPMPDIPHIDDDTVDTGDRIVQVAIYINLVANAVLLCGKVAVIILTDSLSVLASLVDAALDL